MQNNDIINDGSVSFKVVDLGGGVKDLERRETASETRLNGLETKLNSLEMQRGTLNLQAFGDCDGGYGFWYKFGKLCILTCDALHFTNMGTTHAATFAALGAPTPEATTHFDTAGMCGGTVCAEIFSPPNSGIFYVRNMNSNPAYFAYTYVTPA